MRYVSGGDLKLQRHGVAGFGRRVSLSISFLSDVFRRSEGEGGPMEVTATASLTLRHDVGGGTRVLPAKGGFRIESLLDLVKNQVEGKTGMVETRGGLTKLEKTRQLRLSRESGLGEF